MLIHLESGNCNTDLATLDKFTRECYQSKQYVVKELKPYLCQGARLEQRAEVLYSYRSGNYECSRCGKSSETRTPIDLHTRSPIHDCYAFKCPSCDDRFKVPSALLQHVESDRCDEVITSGTGSIAKMLQYLRHRL